MAPKNVVFIRPPKVAGTSIVTALGMNEYASLGALKKLFTQEGWVNFGHMDYAALVEKRYVTKGFDNHAFRFAFVRNPYERAVSLYCYLSQMHPRRSNGDIVPREEFYMPTFHDFVERLARKDYSPIGLYSDKNRSIFNPQVRWTENVNLDFIGRVETIDDDFDELCTLLGIRKRKLHRLRTSKHDPWYTYYDEYTQDIIYNLYKEDFEEFGYEY